MRDRTQPMLFRELEEEELEPPTLEEDSCWWCTGRCYMSNRYCEDCQKEIKPDWNDNIVRERYDTLQTYRKERK